MTIEHTAGNWNFQPSAGRHDFLIYDLATGKDVALVRGDNEQTARLVATAPELLAFARLVAAGNTEFETLERSARDLIAQTEGV